MTNSIGGGNCITRFPVPRAQRYFDSPGNPATDPAS
jgi:hypothetical protein